MYNNKLTKNQTIHNEKNMGMDRDLVRLGHF